MTWRAGTWRASTWRVGTWAGETSRGAAGWDSRKRRRRIVVEVDGRALWFETLEEAQAAIDAMPAPVEAPRPRVRVKVKPAVKPSPDLPSPPEPAEPIDVSALKRWAAEWNAMAAFEARAREMARQDAMRRELDDDDEEALLVLL